MLRILFFSILLFFISSDWALAQFEFNSHNQKAYNAFLKLKIKEGEGYLEKAKQFNSNNGLDLYIANLADVARLIITEDQTLFDELEDHEDERLDALSKLDKSSPYYNFIKAEIKMQWAVVKLKFGKQLPALNNGLSAYNLLKKNEKDFPNFLPHRKTLGAAKVLLGALPAKHQKFVGLLGYKGDVQQGFIDVQSVIDSDSPFALEAELTYAWLQSYVLGDSDASFDYLKKLSKKHSDNLLVSVSASIIGRHAGKANEAYQILESAPKGEAYYEFAFLEYIRSELALQMGDYYASISHAKAFIRNYKGQNYVKTAYLRVFLAYWFLDDSRSWQYFEKAKSNGKSMVVPDEYTAKFLEEELPNKIITQARFYTDGGELEKALKLLSKIDVEALPRERDQIEFYYRKARIMHKKEQYAQSVVEYKRTLALTGKDSRFYFGANTALQLAIIHRDIYKDYASAEYYFREALTYEGHEYESGIDSKAKAGLSGLKKIKEN